jgi:hypothetical protein
MKCYFLVLARDKRHVEKKIDELSSLKVPHLVVCGERMNHPRVVYREARGKYDAINFGAKLIPKDVDIVVLNDVDTKIHNFSAALQEFMREKATLLFGSVMVRGGPQNTFYLFQDKIRRRLFIACEGEMLFIKRKMLDNILPLKPCKGEDTYILFKVLEHKNKAIFCEDCYCETERTKTAKKEEMYKRKTVAGIYQALSYTKPPPLTRIFYILLPFLSPLLLVLGRKGYYWTRGILLGFIDYLRGDRSGVWQTSYME